MTTDIFAILESKRALLTAAAMIWLEIQEGLNVTFPGGVLLLQAVLLGAFVVAESIRPVKPKGVLTKSKAA